MKQILIFPSHILSVFNYHILMSREKHILKDILSGLRQFLATKSPLSDEKCFLFHHKISFRFQDIQIFVFLIKPFLSKTA